MKNILDAFGGDETAGSNLENTALISEDDYL